MSGRPTPEQIAGRHATPYAFMCNLAEHGYVIVHPDDQRARDEAIINATRAWDIREAHKTPHIYGYDAIITAAEQADHA